MRDVLENESLFYETIFLKKIDLCHVFWREDLFRLLNPITIANASKKMGLDYEILVNGINNCAFTTSVYDHLFVDEEKMMQRRAAFSLIDGYTVSSQKLHDIYTSATFLPPPDIIMTDGVDISKFKPKKRQPKPDGLCLLYTSPSPRDRG